SPRIKPRVYCKNLNPFGALYLQI
ncbi:hypothetical protein Zm00014a_002235, partial [Zea mays]